MSKHMKEQITCPECGKKSDFLIWESINTTLDPEMKQAVRDGSAFMFKCPHCGHQAHVDYGFLYHQMEDRIMIHYANSDENAKEIHQMFEKYASDDNPINKMVGDLLHNNYLIRIVRTHNQFLEKLAIFDAGMDDRIIEIIKLFFWAQLHQQDNNQKVDELLMFTAPDGKHIIQFIADGKGFATAEITDDMYNDIQSHFGKNLPDMRKDKIIIDRQWALEHIK